MRARPGERTLRIPYWIYDMGCFNGRPMGSTFQVFACLVRYMDWTTGNGRLGQKKIAAVTGLRDRYTLTRAFARLQELGLVKVWCRKTDRGFIRYYQIARNQAQMRANTIRYLTLRAQKAAGRYVMGNTHLKGAGKSHQQRSSIICTSKKDFSISSSQKPERPLQTTLFRLLGSLSKPSVNADG